MCLVCSCLNIQCFIYCVFDQKTLVLLLLFGIVIIKFLGADDDNNEITKSWIVHVSSLKDSIIK